MWYNMVADGIEAFLFSSKDLLSTCALFHQQEPEKVDGRFLLKGKMNEIKLLEEWKVVDEFPNYAISNYGRVKNIIADKFKSTSPDFSGYPRTDLFNKGFRRTCKIHALVAQYFIGICPEGKEVNHIDGNKQNNFVSNLEYVTRSENIRHAFRNGLIKVDAAWIEKSRLASKKMHEMYDFSGEKHPGFGKKHSEATRQKISSALIGKESGENNPNSKLKTEDVLKIRELYATKRFYQKDLAKMFNVDQTIISSIVLRKIWKNV